MPDPEYSGRSCTHEFRFRFRGPGSNNADENASDHNFLRAAGRPQSRSSINQSGVYSRISKVVFGGTDVKKSPWGWMLCCILSASLPIFSQTATTSLRGTIKDPSGALVPGARITLSNSANGQTLTADA